VGLKEASGNFGKIARLMTLLPEDFLVFSGDDSTALALIALGGRAWISVASNEIPRDMSASLPRRSRKVGRGAQAAAQGSPAMEMNFGSRAPPLLAR
jgi:dihydrodipicolinate synthase/N-acetylneuraminate lyase